MTVKLNNTPRLASDHSFHHDGTLAFSFLPVLPSFSASAVQIEPFYFHSGSPTSSFS